MVSTKAVVYFYSGSHRDLTLEKISSSIIEITQLQVRISFLLSKAFNRRSIRTYFALKSVFEIVDRSVIHGNHVLEMTMDVDYPLLEPPPIIHEPLNDNLIQLEIYKLDDRKFAQKLHDEEAKLIWATLGRTRLELKSVGQRVLGGRCLRITYCLKTQIPASCVNRTPDFQITIDWSGRSKTLTGKILNFNLVEPAKQGEPTKVIVIDAYPELSFNKINNWIEKFGDIVEDLSVQTDKDGVEVGSAECKIVIKHHLPEYLPMYGLKVRIFYNGQPRQCTQCYKLGHVKKECVYGKIGWPEYISKLKQTGAYNEPMFGSWLDSNSYEKRTREDDRVEYRHKTPKRQRNQPADLRDHLRTKDARERINNNRVYGRYERSRTPQYRYETPPSRDYYRQAYGRDARYQRTPVRYQHRTPPKYNYDLEHYNRYHYHGEPRRRSPSRTPEQPRVRSVVIDPTAGLTDTTTRKRSRSPNADGGRERRFRYEN